MEHRNDDLVLCDKRWIASRKDRKNIVIISVLMLIAYAALFYLFIFPLAGNSDIKWGEVLAKSLTQIRIDPLVVAMFFALLAQFIFMKRAKRLERLILSSEGIQYISPLPRQLKRFMPDWTLAWNQVTRIELRTAQIGSANPLLVALSFICGKEEQKIFPLRWVNPATYSPPNKFKEAFKYRAQSSHLDDLANAVSESEIVRYMSEKIPHIVIESRLDNTAMPTGLEKDPHGKVAMVLIFMLIAYAMVDFLVGPEAYIDQPPPLFYFAVGTLAALLSGFWLSGSKLVLPEKIGLALLIGGVAGAAMLPGALRINALFNSAQVYEYRVDTSGNGILLQPLAEGMPSIDYFSDSDYWARYGKEDTYPVKIRKGILGFYQFDAASITDEIHRFHSEKKAGG